ncbi:type IV secretory system conjugative DNA transfer family protein [Magnetospirillum molischianum]|uniref:Conjugal transfer protein traG n=1 Tax=Magnetospirillum molischianum DSM 120 TaxID=1150626 RepID=H8FVU6_MAGML|nr:type IV secretory system conjugative DNA transfer family protein [Magnetospirillum molischianum]CCG42484.1 Conjugal transfer protein traG [Magnetospirillum molischianum DSM 120]
MRLLLLPVAILLVVFITGLVWQVGFGFYPLEAASWVWVQDYLRAYHQLPLFLTASLFGVAAALIVLIVLLQALASRIGGRTTHGGHDDTTLHGSARWATKADVRKAGLMGKTGVVVGGWPGLMGKIRTLRHDGPEHVLAFAPTRSGKGVGLVLPTLLSWPGSVLVLDIKGENWRLTSGWRAAQGQRILKFDPTAESGGLRFNPLAEIRLDSNHAIADAQNIAAMIIDPDGKGLADFWAKSGFSWLTAAILYTLYKVRADQGRVATLTDVDTILTASGEGGLDHLLADMIRFETGAEATTRLIRSAGQEMQDRAAQERSGVQSSSKVDLSLYRDPIVAQNIAASDFRLSDLMNGESPASLYLVVPPSDIDRLRPLLRVILNLVLRRLMQSGDAPKYRHRLLLMLDEFTSVGKLEIFERALAFMAGYGLKAFLIIQDLTQLQGAYGRENSIVGNCHIRVAYAPNEVATAKVLSDLCGKTTIVQTRSTRSRQPLALSGTVTDSVAEVARPLLTPDECMRLKAAVKSRRDPARIVRPGEMLVFAAGYPPILGRQPLYFLNRTLLERSQLAPVGTDRNDGNSEPDSDPSVPVTDPSGFADRIRAAARSSSI